MKIILPILIIFFTISAICKKSHIRYRNKDFVQVHDYNLSQVGFSHSGNSDYDRTATATAMASPYGRIPNNHPILTVYI